MNTLKSILLATILGAAAVMPAKAQQIISETSASYASNVTVPLQRVRAIIPGQHESITITQDFNSGKQNLITANISSNLQGPYNLGFIAYRMGDMTGKHAALAESWLQRDFGNNNKIMLDVGATLEASVDAGRLDWTILKARTGNFEIGAAELNTTTNGERKASYYGLAALGNDNRFASVGYNAGTFVGLTGLRFGNKVGNVSYLLTNPDTKAWTFKSQTGIGDIDPAFFNQGLYRYANSYFSIPPFHPVHFSPFDTKGNTSVMFYGTGTANTTFLDAMVGRRITSNLQAGAGVSFTRNGTDHIGVPVHMNWTVPIGPARVNLEAQTDVTTGKTDAYLNVRIGS